MQKMQKINKQTTNLSDKEDQDFNDSKHLGYFEKTVKHHKIEVYLDEEIKHASYYRPLFQRINELDENDELEIVINSTGGDLFTAINFINLIKQSPANVVCVIDGVCMSAASMIALSSGSIVIAPNSTMMIHNYSSYAYGKGNDLMTRTTYLDKLVKKVMSECYEGFLSTEELAEVFLGVDMWLDSEQIIARLEKRKDYFENKNKVLDEVESKSKKK